MTSLCGWRWVSGALLVAAALLPAACKRFQYVSMKPLDDAGFSYTYQKQIEEQNPTNEEVAEVVKAWRGGLSESACVDLVRISRGQKRHFAEGDAVAALHAANISDPSILELARLQQIDSWAGQAQAIRLTGVSEAVILAVARRRAAGQPVPSGASLARLKDSGMSEATLLELLNRNAADADVDSLVWRKKHGWKDEQVLQGFPAKP